MRKPKLNQKYFVNNLSQLSIQCLSCKKTRTFPVEILREKQQAIKVKCSCEHTFTIDIEFRKHYRRKVDFSGKYRLATASVEEVKNCIVADLSLGGLSIKIINDESIAENDELIVNFRLDDEAHHEIERKIQVRHIDQKNRIGGEFIDSKNNDPNEMLNFYLL